RVVRQMIDHARGDRDEQFPTRHGIVVRRKREQCFQDILNVLRHADGCGAFPVVGQRPSTQVVSHIYHSPQPVVTCRDRRSGVGGVIGATGSIGVTGKTPAASSPGCTCVLKNMTTCVRYWSNSSPNTSG